MNAKGIEAVVISKLAFRSDHQVAKYGREHTQGQRSDGLYNSGGRSYGDKTGENAAGKTQRRCFSLVHAFNDQPGQCTGCGGELGGGERLCRAQATGNAAAGIEAKPSYP